MPDIEFYIAAVSTADGPIWSEVIWSNDENALKGWKDGWNYAPDPTPPGAILTLHGPFTAGAPLQSAKA